MDVNDRTCEKSRGECYVRLLTKAPKPPVVPESPKAVVGSVMNPEAVADDQV